MTNLHFAVNGACQGMDSAVFFPGRGEKISDEAVKACGSCPCQAQCLDWAVQHESVGYWGGTSEKTRRAMRKHLKIRLVSPSMMAELWDREWWLDERVRAS
jgi:hypothetical protein